MKKTLKKVLASVTTLATMATALIPLNASASAKLLYTYPDGTEVWGGVYDEVVGFDEDGNPIIDLSEEGVRAYANLSSEGGIPSSAEVTTVNLLDCPEGGTPTEDESDDDSLYSEPTNIRGDVNYDGLVNNVDVMLLRKYILHMIEW